jgi:endonuclease YncB( thermonuclease family)
MKKTLVLIPLLLAAFLFAKDPISVLSGRVVKVSDGDTITVLNADNEQKRIRLYGIDAPEKKQPYGEAARKYLADQVAGLDIDVSVYDVDRYGRSVGRIIIDGSDVNRAMIAAGLAWVYPQYCKIPECAEWKQIEQEAGAARRGLWQEPNPTPPWEWRRKK